MSTKPFTFFGKFGFIIISSPSPSYTSFFIHGLFDCLLKSIVWICFSGSFGCNIILSPSSGYSSIFFYFPSGLPFIFSNTISAIFFSGFWGLINKISPSLASSSANSFSYLPTILLKFMFGNFSFSFSGSNSKLSPSTAPSSFMMGSIRVFYSFFFISNP